MRTLFITGGAGFIGSNLINKYIVEYPDDKIINLLEETYKIKKLLIKYNFMKSF